MQEFRVKSLYETLRLWQGKRQPEKKKGGGGFFSKKKTGIK